MTKKTYRATVFGKEGCAKCTQLKNRLTKMITKGTLTDLDMEYKDVLTVPGMVDFSELECLNPQRIPALVVSRFNDKKDRYDVIPTPVPGKPDDVCQASRLYQIMGIQTDYSGAGKGIITPQMIQHVIEQAQHV